MARDRREEILSKVQSLLAGVAGLKNPVCYRNRDAFDDQRFLPAVILLDGSEERLTDIGRASGVVYMPASVVALTPQIFIQARPRDDESNEQLDGVAAPIGPELSMWRTKVLKALTTDANLVALLGSNGQIEYVGCVTDMQTGSALEGMIQFNFRFSYVLRPDEL